MDFMAETGILLVSGQQTPSEFSKERKTGLTLYFYTDSFHSGTKQRFSTSIIAIFGSDDLHIEGLLSQNVRNACDNQLCL